MKHRLAILAALILAPFAALRGAELELTSPLDYQVIQRVAHDQGMVRIAGEISEELPKDAVVEARLIFGKTEPAWQTLDGKLVGRSWEAQVEGLAGGWYRLEVRMRRGEQVVAQSSVEHVGIGEVFVVAGQSNSANHGEEKLTPQTGRVATFDGSKWRIAADPQPGASGGGGSFIPAFGDAVVEKLNMPVGIVACGIGATSVREWLPKGSTFPNPPTIESRVEKLPSGEWASKGAAFEMFVARMKPLGPRGFRAVLWHQGESDANQRDATRTLSGRLYADSLKSLIRESRRAIGWDAPWFVAQVSYHVPGDEGAPEIRAAQASLWKDGLALEGPDSDALKGDLRERNGQGVHFSGKGLREHGAKWAEKVIPWVESQPKNVIPPTALWKDYDPNLGDFKEEIVKQETRDGAYANITYDTTIVRSTDFNAAISSKLGPAKATDTVSDVISSSGYSAWTNIAELEGPKGIKGFRSTDNGRGSGTEQLHDPKWKAPANARLSFKFYCTEPQTVVLTADDHHSVELEITASDEWQEMTLAPERLIHPVNPKPLPDRSSSRSWQKKRAATRSDIVSPHTCSTPGRTSERFRSCWGTPMS